MNNVALHDQSIWILQIDLLKYYRKKAAGLQ